MALDLVRALHRQTAEKLRSYTPRAVVKRYRLQGLLGCGLLLCTAVLVTVLNPPSLQQSLHVMVSHISYLPARDLHITITPAYSTIARGMNLGHPTPFVRQLQSPTQTLQTWHPSGGGRQAANWVSRTRRPPHRAQRSCSAGCVTMTRGCMSTDIIPTGGGRRRSTHPCSLGRALRRWPLLRVDGYFEHALLHPRDQTA